MKAFIPVVTLGSGRFWSNDHALWEAVHPGWWSLMERTFNGEHVFENPPTSDTPHMIVNIPAPGTSRDPEPGMLGTLDIWPGGGHVIFSTTWGAAGDLVPEKVQYWLREPHRARIHAWFSGHRGFRGGCSSSTDRMVFGAGHTIHERVEAESFQGFMDVLSEHERVLRAKDAEARVKFRKDLGFDVPLRPF